ncbi:MAG: phosphoribosylamine--glycine ligase [Bacteriovoracaceae bacterium]|nr:phosphoribosylamine--glycine ligase [Bacteriovoracaceae bacterium]
MKLLLLGSGGREYTFAWKISQSPIVDEIIVAPGNDGFKRLDKVKLVSIDLSNAKQITALAQEYNVSLVVVGPEQPLVDGIVDALEANKIKVFGPSKLAAKAEGSKAFAKDFMIKNNIPTAKHASFDSYQAACKYIETYNVDKGVVIKASQLAAGKGVVVTHDKTEALDTLYDFMENPKCTINSKVVVIEDKLEGKEVSAFAICDGKTFIPFGYACDYKRVYDNDEGPNTGGMGTFTPTNWPSEECKKMINERVFQAFMDGMKELKTPFKGVLFAGLMINDDTPKVIEFNARFGDPEAQVLLPLLDVDIVPALLASADGDLSKVQVKFKNQVAVHVVMTSGGYPSVYGEAMNLGNRIYYGQVSDTEDKILIFSGVKLDESGSGDLVNSGGRVLGVTALADTQEEAKNLAYDEIKKIKFHGAHWRLDIGK